MAGLPHTSSNKKQSSSVQAVSSAVGTAPHVASSNTKVNVPNGEHSTSREETATKEPIGGSVGLAERRKTHPKAIHTSSSSSRSSTSRGHSSDKADDAVVMEFGGPVGVTAIALIFPVIMLYMYCSLEFHAGQIFLPKDLMSLASWRDFFGLFASHIEAKALPTVYAAQIYLGYVLLSAVLAYIMPGPVIKGMPVPSLGGKQLTYDCNGYSSFYFTCALALLANHFEVFKLRDIIDNFGHLVTTAIITGFVMSILMYVIALAMGSGHRMSGNHIYDCFMGAPLNPRIGRLDLKMWSEIRVPWIILYFVSLSAVVKVWEDAGGDLAALLEVPFGLWFTLLGHWLYTNACMKGEDCIPASWDIFYEKWGFMLIFWNMAGVPFTYCYNTLYLLKRWESGNALILSWGANVALFVTILAAYVVWDLAQAQKAHFRQAEAGTLIHRWTFPQLPGGFLHNPRHIKTKQGSPLLTGGFWGVARKIHYTADFVMAMCWALVCGFSSPIPYFYPFFFCCVLVHRVSRDMERCAAKYGDDWKRYCKEVPYIFIPYVF